MQALMRAVYNAVMEFYDYAKPWKQDFVTFTIAFDELRRDSRQCLYRFVRM